MRLRTFSIIIAVAVLLGLISSGFMYVRSMLAITPEPPRNQEASSSLREVAGWVGKTAVTFEIADTPATRLQGLSGRQVLPENHAVLFDFGHAAYPSMWMKDMHFPLDFIWVDEDQTIVGITTNVAPDTYPQTFAPPEPARFVIEVNAGWVDRHQITKGERVLW